ncbi:MAG TPA: CobD/CbiB family cobalamin biosynthesis protein [Solirubrobacteraceae bacterium]|nr:CobD/CbiB family cobalamin biosynthesis protein [Solirubrobacteraceae bacterium]
MRSGERDALALALGFALDRALGDPHHGHPVAGFGALAAALERRTWRPCRRAGVAHVAVLLAPAAWIGRRAGANPFTAALAVWVALGGRSLERAALRMVALLEAGDLPGARAHAPVLVGRDPRELDEPELCRATIESVAENTADALLGALLWGALAGPAGVAVYRAANTLDAMIGHRDPRYERFGWAAARLDDLLGWPAARLTVGLTALVAPLAGADAGRALRIAWRDGARHPSPNAGPVEAAFAGALGLRLGGTNRYAGGSERRPPLGDGRAPGVEDIARTVLLSRLVGRAGAIACALLALACGLAHRLAGATPRSAS